MKKLFSVVLLAGSFATLQAQNSPYYPSAGAHALVETYRDVVAKVNTVNCVSNGNYHCTYSTMPTKCYNVGTLKDSGLYVTFTTFYYSTASAGNATFRTSWTNSAWGAYQTVCATCYPKPIVFPYPVQAKYTNDVYEAMLVPVRSYMTFTKPKTYNNCLSIALPINNIQAINELYIEPATGYINKTEPDRYKALYSSGGVVCQVKLMNGQSVDCYIINNYEGTATGVLRWKEPVK